MRKSNKINIGDISKQVEVRKRHFDFWDVNEIIPSLEFYVKELHTIKEKIKSLDEVIKKCSSEDDSENAKLSADPILSSLKKKMKHQCNEYVSIIEKFAEKGAIVDDLDVMAFDFYSWHEGEEIFLCWQSGEVEVSCWHYPEENFSERRQLEITDVLRLDDYERLLN